MKNYIKTSVVLAAVSVCAIASAGTTQVNKTASAGNPVAMTTPTKVDPISMQACRFTADGTAVPVGPVIPYQPNPVAAFCNTGSLILDAYEPVDPAANDVPGDSLTSYGPATSGTGVPLGEQFFPAAPGTRYTYGGALANASKIAVGYKGVYAGQLGKMANAADFLIRVTGTTPVTKIVVFTYNDVYDPTAPVAPTSANNGVILTYGGIPAGFYYTAPTFAAVPIPTPATASGYYALEFGIDNGSGGVAEVAGAAPGYWTTKVPDPTHDIPTAYWADTTQTGTFDALRYDTTTSTTSTVTSYAATRGAETTAGGNNPTILNTPTAGTNVTIQQRKQLSPVFPNAEITGVVNEPASIGAISALRELRVAVQVTANANPVGAPTALMTISLFNNTTSAYDAVYQGQPVNSGGDGTFILCPSVQVPNIPNYLTTNSDGSYSATVRVSVRQSKPLSPNWSLTVHQLSINAGTTGPDPLMPTLALFTTL